MARQPFQNLVLPLGVFIATFAVGAIVTLSAESPLFVFGLSACFGGLVGLCLLIGIGRSAWATRRALFLAAFSGLLAYPGHFLARAVVEGICSSLSVQRLPGAPSATELAIEFVILAGYWFALPFALGRFARGSLQNTP